MINTYSKIMPSIPLKIHSERTTQIVTLRFSDTAFPGVGLEPAPF